MKAVEALKKLNVPYLVSLPLVFQTTEEWLESELGVHPVQVALQVMELFPLMLIRSGSRVQTLVRVLQSVCMHGCKTLSSFVMLTGPGQNCRSCFNHGAKEMLKRARRALGEC